MCHLVGFQTRTNKTIDIITVCPPTPISKTTQKINPLLFLIIYHIIQIEQERMVLSAVAFLALVLGLSRAEYRNEITVLKLANLTPPATWTQQLTLAQESDTLLSKTEDDTCPTWFLPVTGNHTSKCGNDLDGIVVCYNTTQSVYLHRCYCIFYNEDTNDTVVGNCQYSCFQSTMRHSPYFSLPSNVSKLENTVCQQYHREGQLCGRCNDTFNCPTCLLLHSGLCAVFGLQQQLGKVPSSCLSPSNSIRCHSHHLQDKCHLWLHECLHSGQPNIINTTPTVFT